MGALADAGYQVIGVNEDSPTWKEAFLHPKDSWGMVIQVAWAGGDGWDDAPPLPPTRHVSTTKIATVVHLVADVQAAADLFDGPLGMERTDEWKDPNIGTGVDLRSGPWNLKLIQPTDANLAHWMGNRPGRLRALHFQLDDPSLVPDAQRVGARGGEQQQAMFIVPPSTTSESASSSPNTAEPRPHEVAGAPSHPPDGPLLGGGRLPAVYRY